MKKKVINQMLRRLGFEYNDYQKSWAPVSEEPTPRSRYRYRNTGTNTVSLERPNGKDYTKTRTGLNFVVKKGWDTIFNKSVAQLTEDEFYKSLRDNFPEVKGLRRRDILDELLSEFDLTNDN